MSMFDEIKFKIELPLPEELKKLNIVWKDYTFQTKDLVNCLSNYWVSEEGELFEHVIEREYISYTKEERKSANINPWNLWKDVIEKNQRDEKVNHHGVINFYTYDEYPSEKDFEPQDYWVEFDAYFVYGKLDKIELKEFRFEPSRALINKQIAEEWEKEQKQPWNVFKKYANYVGWKWFWKKVDKGLFAIDKLISNIRSSILRNFL